MDTSILIAKFLGPVLLVASISMVVNQGLIESIFEDIVKSPALIYMAGVMALLTGIAILIFHNLWVADWRVIVTIFGWLSLFAGIFRMVFPGLVIGMAEKLIGRGRTLMFIGGLNLLLGGFLTFMGYWA